MQEVVLQQSDRSREYKDIRDRVTGLVDARARIKGPNGMDCSAVDKEELDDEYDRDEEVNAVGEPIRCYRCQGFGHRALECPTPKGKGKDR